MKTKIFSLLERKWVTCVILLSLDFTTYAQDEEIVLDIGDGGGISVPTAQGSISRKEYAIHFNASNKEISDGSEGVISYLRMKGLIENVTIKVIHMYGENDYMDKTNIDIGSEIPLSLAKGIYQYYRDSTDLELTLSLYNGSVKRHVLIGTNADFSRWPQPLIINPKKQKKVMRSKSMEELIERFKRYNELR